MPCFGGYSPNALAVCGAHGLDARGWGVALQSKNRDAGDDAGILGPLH